MKKEKSNNPMLEFKINTPQFLKEVFNENPKLGVVFKIPANIFREYLIQIANRAAELNDPKLNAIMCQMALYSIADPYSPEFNKSITEKIILKKYEKATI